MAQRLNIDIVARDKASKALNGLRGGLAKVRGAVFNLRNAFLGLGAGLVVLGLRALLVLRCSLLILAIDSSLGLSRLLLLDLPPKGCPSFPPKNAGLFFSALWVCFSFFFFLLFRLLKHLQILLLT